MNTALPLVNIGKYRLIAAIGQGGMAHIHLALVAGPGGFNKLVVIKALREDLAASGDEFVAMFLDEARLAARLSHPNIVQTYDVGEMNGRFFIAMEYLEGQSLKTIDRRLLPRALPLAHRLRIISEVGKGLHHAHELRGFGGEPLNVVHRDVSPQNVFVTYEGQVKLLDFGIAKAANSEHLTKVGVIKGKADYIAPEQIRGDTVDRRADVFALGVLLYEALSRRRFAGGREITEIAKMHNRLTGSEPKLRTVYPGVPEQLAQICDKAIAIRPEDRYATALELSDDIDRALAEAASHPTAQQLSALFSPFFQNERDQLHRIVDEQTRLVLDPVKKFDLGPAKLPMLPRTNYTSGVWTLPPQTASGQTPTHLSGSLAPTPIAGSVAPLATGPNVIDEIGSKKRVPWPLLVSGVAVAFAIAVFSAVRPASSETMRAAVEPKQSAESAKAGAAPSKPAANDRVRLKVRVTPSAAEVRIDGARISTIPFEAETNRSKQMHTLEVSAPGFETHRQMLTYDRDLDINVALSHLKVAKRHATRAREKEKPSEEKAAPAPSRALAPLASEITPAHPKPAPAIEPGMDLRRVRARSLINERDQTEIDTSPYR